MTSTAMAQARRDAQFPNSPPSIPQLPIIDVTKLNVWELSGMIADLHRLHLVIEEAANLPPFVMMAAPMSVPTPLAHVLDSFSGWCSGQRQAAIRALDAATPSDWTERAERFTCLLEWTAGADDERFFGLVEEYRAFRAK